MNSSFCKWMFIGWCLVVCQTTRAQLEDYTLSKRLDSAERMLFQNELKAAESIIRSAYQEAVASNDSSGMARSLNLLGSAAYKQDQQDSALVYFQEARTRSLSIGDSVGYAYVLLNLAELYSDQNQLDSANLMGLEALRIGQRFHDLRIRLSSLYILGNLYYFVGDYKTVDHYLKMGIEDPELSRTKNTLTLYSESKLLDIYATNLGELGQFELARTCYSREDSIGRLLQDSSVIMLVEYGLGYLDLYEGKPLSGIRHCRDALDYYISKRDIYFAEGCIECIGRGHFIQGQLDSALYYLLDAEKSAEAHAFYDFKSDIYDLLYKIYEKKGNYPLALRYFKLHKEQSDSLQELANRSNISIVESQFQFQQLKLTAATLEEYARRDQAIIDSQKKTNLLITIALALVITLAGLLYYLYHINRNRNRILEVEVASRTRELTETNESLLLANAELEEFAHISSHDLKEPIRNINSFSSLIEKKLGGISTEELQDYLSIIRFNAGQMQQLVNAVYEFVHINKEGIQVGRVSVSEVVQDVRQVLHSLIAESGGEVVLGVHPEHVVTNRGMLFLILRNLIENGLKYNRSDLPRVEISIERSGRFDHWEVRDNGMGIAPQYHQRIFELFKRLHNREEFQGSGLGLSITRKVVNRLGGEIGVVSEEGHGSVFWFRLPTGKPA